MPTPNDPTPPKKPVPPGAKPGEQPPSGIQPAAGKPLWGILDEAKTTGDPVGTVAVARGLINEDQLLQALADQHGLKVVNLEETKPAPEALQLVPETMAAVYKIIPLAARDKSLTVAMG